MQIFFKIFLVLPLVISLQNKHITAQTRENLSLEIDKAFNYEIDFDTAKTPAWVIGLIDHDSTWVFSYGRNSKLDWSPPNSRTLFNIGNIGKVYLAEKFFELEQENYFKRSDSLSKHLPPSWKCPATDKISLEQLLLHTSGLPKLPDGFGNIETHASQPFKGFSEELMRETLLEMDTLRLRSGVYQFSNWGYAVLEYMLKYTLSKKIKTLKISALDTNSTEPIQGYSLSGKAVDAWEFDEAFQLSLGMRAHVLDLLKLIRRSMPQTEFHKPIVPTRIEKKTAAGLVWHIIEQTQKHTICIQVGSTAGHSAFVAFVPQTKTGVVILTNSKATQSHLGFLLLKMLNFNWKRKK
jgi:serine-type D-Ala-D-Ala carboxypeptidase/endopeptidase